jgi:hypothetical protein
MSEIRDGGVYDVRHPNNMNTARLLRRPGHHKLKYLPGVDRHWGTRLTEGLEVFDGHKLECSGELGWWCCLVRVVGLALLPLKYRSSIDFFLIEREVGCLEWMFLESGELRKLLCCRRKSSTG